MYPSWLHQCFGTLSRILNRHAADQSGGAVAVKEQDGSGKEQGGDTPAAFKRSKPVPTNAESRARPPMYEASSPNSLQIQITAGHMFNTPIVTVSTTFLHTSLRLYYERAAVRL